MISQWSKLLNFLVIRDFDSFWRIALENYECYTAEECEGVRELTLTVGNDSFNKFFASSSQQQRNCNDNNLHFDLIVRSCLSDNLLLQHIIFCYGVW